MMPDGLSTWPTDRLVQFALLDHLECPEDEVDPRDGAVLFLSQRSRDGHQDVIDAARQLCASVNARERQLGIRVLASAATIHDEVVSLLLEMLEREVDPFVIGAIALALGERSDPRAIEPLLALKDHADEQVRYGVVIGLLAQEDSRAVQTLIELSDDEDREVRDLATFGLGSQLDIDTPEVREALVQRLTDPDEDTQSEAVLGLARRRDERVLLALIEAIDARWDSQPIREAAEAYPHPDVLAALEQTLGEDHPDWTNWARGILAGA